MTPDPRMQSGLAPELFAKLVTGNPPRIGEDGSIFTGATRLSWPALSKPAKPQNPGQVGKYQANFLWPHKGIGMVMQALQAAVRQHYPSVPDPNIFLDPRNKNHPVKDQGLRVAVADGGMDPIKKTVAGYVPGLPFATAKSVQAVGCMRFLNGKPTAMLPDDIDKMLYAGCWVTAKFVIIKSTAAGNPGVFFGLQSVLKLADDTKFGGSGSANPEDFQGAVAIEDPNANQIMQSTGAAANDWSNSPAPGVPATNWD